LGAFVLARRRDRAAVQHAVVFAYQAVGLPRVAGGQVEVAIAVIIPPRHTLGAVALGRRPDGAGCQHATVVAVQAVGLPSVADGEVEVAVAVIIAPRQAVAACVGGGRATCSGRDADDAAVP